MRRRKHRLSSLTVTLLTGTAAILCLLCIALAVKGKPEKQPEEAPQELPAVVFEVTESADSISEQTAEPWTSESVGRVPKKQIPAIPQTEEKQNPGIREYDQILPEGPEQIAGAANTADTAAGNGGDAETAGYGSSSEPEQSGTGASAQAGTGATGQAGAGISAQAGTGASEQAGTGASDQGSGAAGTAGTGASVAETPAIQNTARAPEGYGRILFVGDSRTIDMFADSDQELTGLTADDIVVYAKHGYGYGYLVEVVDRYGHDNFDTLVTWMGANDRGDFGNYEIYYNHLLDEGKRIVVCTVGPTNTDYLEDEEDIPNYANEKMIAFNNALISWANSRGVRVIDLYGYVRDNVEIDPADGVHYLPRPTSSLWNYIVSSLHG